jgi:hypothetical protein
VDLQSPCLPMPQSSSEQTGFYSSTWGKPHGTGDPGQFTTLSPEMLLKDAFSGRTFQFCRMFVG